ncbi:hypothetical protein [Fodinibius roseus]|uniref:hypothetical protein n=1 Tax=Fodinibius roseus TaxID=1194090 RepID=UPI00147EA42C|nr:hypothetical protein [Fodinibius roseus]
MEYTSSEARPTFMEEKITVEIRDKSVRDVLDILENKLPVQFTYQEHVISNRQYLSGSFKNLTLDTILSQLFEGSNIKHVAIPGDI